MQYRLENTRQPGLCCASNPSVKAGLISAALLFLVVCPAPGNEYYVAGTNGADDNPGTKEKPFKSISKAAALAQAGDTVFIRGGVYRESISVDRKGTAEKPITIRNFEGEAVIVKGSTLYSPGDFVETDMPGFDPNNDFAKRNGIQPIKILKKDDFPVNPSQVSVNGAPLRRREPIRLHPGRPRRQAMSTPGTVVANNRVETVLALSEFLERST